MGSNGPEMTLKKLFWPQKPQSDKYFLLQICVLQKNPEMGVNKEGALPWIEVKNVLKFVLTLTR